MKKEILILLFITVISYGQVNTEKYRKPENVVGISGVGELSGTIKTGNVEKTEIHLDGRVDYNLEHNLTFLIIQTEYEWNNGTRSSNDALLHLRHVVDLVKNLKAEAFFQINYNKEMLLNDRELLGAGLRYNLLSADKNQLWYGSAYMFEHESYDLPQTAIHPRKEDVSRWSNYLTYVLDVNKIVRFSSVIYYQPRFDDFADYRILSENSFVVSLTEVFSMSINFSFRYDSYPPDTIKDTDTKTNFGIAVQF